MWSLRASDVSWEEFCKTVDTWALLSVGGR